MVKLFTKAKRSLRAAEILRNSDLYSDSASRCYYALFLGMWAFVGDPPKGRWKHDGLRKVFLRELREETEQEALKPYSLREINQGIRVIYSLRRRADYSYEDVEEADAKDALDFGTWLLDLLERRCER